MTQTATRPMYFWMETLAILFSAKFFISVFALFCNNRYNLFSDLFPGGNDFLGDQQFRAREQECKFIYYLGLCFLLAPFLNMFGILRLPRRGWGNDQPFIGTFTRWNSLAYSNKHNATYLLPHMHLNLLENVLNLLKLNDQYCQNLVLLCCPLFA